MSLDRQYSSDSPIHVPEEDRFSRWPFSERLANVINTRRDPSSIIIGIYGAWGEGKTSVLNFIEHAFQGQKEVVCRRFNPWRYGTEEQLLQGFFLMIADAIDTDIITKGEKIKELI